MTKQNTPWGPSDSINKIAPGIAFLSTPSHGGYRISKALAEKYIPEVQRLQAAIFQGNYYWFEEDCAWSVVAINFPLLFPDLRSGEALEVYNRWFSDKLAV